jgi:hypothetical protein
MSVDINILCHLISMVTVTEDFARYIACCFFMRFFAPIDLAPQIVDGPRVLYFKSGCRKHASYQ